MRIFHSASWLGSCEKSMMPLVYDLEIWHKCLGPKTRWQPPISTLHGQWQRKYWTEENVDFRFFAKMVARTTSGSNSRVQISTFRTRFYYMERIFRPVPASISEFKRLTISAFGLSDFADQATICRFLPSCQACNFATVSPMQTKLSTIVVLIW